MGTSPAVRKWLSGAIHREITQWRGAHAADWEVRIETAPNGSKIDVSLLCQFGPTRRARALAAQFGQPSDWRELAEAAMWIAGVTDRPRIDRILRAAEALSTHHELVLIPGGFFTYEVNGRQKRTLQAVEFR